jgi:hypothetical protein
MFTFLLLAGTAALFPRASSMARVSSTPCTWQVGTTLSPAGSNAQFTAVSELRRRVVWAVATTRTGNLIERWNGRHWRVVAGPKTGGGLYAVDAVKSDDVWFAGDARNEPLIEHWNGARISVVPNPLKSGTLQSLFAASLDDVWVTGYDDSQSPPLIERWNGTAWRVVRYPGEDMFVAISGTSSSDIWAGGSGIGGSSVPFADISHWNGLKWSSPNSSVFGQPGTNVSAVLAVSRTDVWAVGQSAEGGALIAHFNGSMWHRLPARVAGANLVALSGRSATGVLTSGGTGSGRALIERWTGSSWAQALLPVLPGSTSFLHGIATGPSGDGWAVGFYRTRTGSHTLALHRSCQGLWSARKMISELGEGHAPIGEELTLAIRLRKASTPIADSRPSHLGIGRVISAISHTRTASSMSQNSGILLASHDKVSGGGCKSRFLSRLGTLYHPASCAQPRVPYWPESRL